jgi:hypothetical protein
VKGSSRVDRLVTRRHIKKRMRLPPGTSYKAFGLVWMQTVGPAAEKLSRAQISLLVRARPRSRLRGPFAARRFCAAAEKVDSFHVALHAGDEPEDITLDRATSPVPTKT